MQYYNAALKKNAKRQCSTIMQLLKKKGRTPVHYYNAALTKNAERQHCIIMELLKKNAKRQRQYSIIMQLLKKIPNASTAL